jgi:hypothetical protein
MDRGAAERAGRSSSRRTIARWEACRIEPFHSAVDVDLADAHIMDAVAMGTIEFQRQLPVLAETLHIHLDVSGRLSARIRTGKEEACHSDLLRFLKKEVDTSRQEPAALRSRQER